MINKIWNWIKNIFKSEKQDPHLTLYEEPVNRKLEKIRRKHVEASLNGWIKCIRIKNTNKKLH